MDNYTKNLFLPVVFNNVKSYDAHFLIKQFKKQYTALSRDQNDNDINEQEKSVACGDICVIPLNGEQYGVDNYTKNLFLPVVFNNAKSYDAHFLIKQFKKQYTALSRDQNDNDINEREKSVAYGDICVIPLNGEQYLPFQVKKNALHLLFLVSLYVSGHPRVAVIAEWSR